MLITNDGATILNKMSVMQPAAKMLVELSKSQAGSLLCGGVLTLCTGCGGWRWDDISGDYLRGIAA